jgi:photosystem II stability/assembly factor-like uncharacterized protein
VDIQYDRGIRGTYLRREGGNAYLDGDHHSIAFLKPVKEVASMAVHSYSRRARLISLKLLLPSICAFAMLLLIASAASAAVSFQDISPNNSDFDASDPDGAAGGRVNLLASVAGNNQIFYAATEWGGLYKTTDAGQNWFRLNGHLPVATWDIKVDPGNTNNVYATSFYDGRVNPVSGIQVSRDAGVTWTHPATAQPPAAFQCTNAFGNIDNFVRTEPSAFGIGIRPDASANVFIGTNCGLARSTDSGATWQFIDPTPGDNGASRVWDVLIQAGGPTSQGIIDICGDDRHWRSTDGGATWTGGSAGLPRGRCSLAASPDESYVLFVYAADNNIYESDDGGANWTNLGTPDSNRQGRVPFVATNQRANTGGNNIFDLWAGDVRLFRAGCTTPATPAVGGAQRCPLAATGMPPATPPAGWAGPFTRSVGAHDDVGDLVFDTQAANDACPMILSSDGGVYRNTDTGADCQNPDWDQPNVVPHALWVYGMGGVNMAGAAAEGLFFGTQDDGSWASLNAGAASPGWSNKDCCDIFDVVPDPNRIVYTICCTFSILLADQNMNGGTAIATNPPGCCVSFQFQDFIDRIADLQYIAVTSQGGFITTDITASPITWTQLGTASTPAGGFCAVQASFNGGTPSFYALTRCIPGGGGIFETPGSGQLWRYDGTAPGGTWQRVDNNDGVTGGIGIFAVDRNNPANIYASNMAPAGPRMIFSTDGGQNWENDAELDVLMTGNGMFNYRNQRGPTPGAVFNGYSQPSLLAFDPEDSNVIVAGGRDSGVFLSRDGGQNWGLLTDPLTSHTSGIPHLPRPWFAYFDHEPAGTINLFIGTQGRGVWRLAIVAPIADANGPYVTDEGQDIILDGTASSGALSYEWDFNNDGIFDAGFGPTPTFDSVGQDGVFPVSLKVTNGGVVDIDSTTVTVNNVAPTVSLSSNAPANEGSPVTVSGTVTDPGWLDPLTATVDWGDGSAIEPLAGSLENTRPDATLTFSISHIYGDNGIFNASICGSDDDTTTCADIALQIDNVSPTADIDETAAVTINGIPTFLAHAGEPILFYGRSMDPGSDDLTLSWDWDDGSPSPDVITIDLVNPPDSDPFPSPSIQPRDVTDDQTHAFGEACLYEITFSSVDDDGGSASDNAIVVTTGNEDRARSSGDWQHQYGRQGRTDFSDSTLVCYLEIIGYVSTVFSEGRDASSIPAAHDILFLRQNGGSETEQLDRELMTAWLNFANGAFEYDEMFDPDRDGVSSPFAEIMAAAESVRISPTATTEEIREQKNILQQLR